MKQIKTSKATVFLIGENHIRIQIDDKVVLEVADMVDINNAKFELVENKKYTVLFIPGMFASITTEARAFSASREMNHNAIAKAILVTSTTDRLIGNFFIKINRPPAPTSLFNTETEAMLWLEKMSAHPVIVN